MKIQSKHIDYKWVVLIMCFMMEFVCLGFCSSNAGLYTGKVTAALGIDRSDYNIGTSIRYIVQVLVGLYFGTLIQRFGIKKLVGVGLFSLCGSITMRFLTAALWHHYVGCVLWGLGIALAGGTMASLVVRRWFDKDIGKYTGIVMSANGIGGAIAAQIISPIINNGETFGYRKAYLLSAIVSVIISVVVLIFIGDNPNTEAAPTKGTKKARGQVWEGIPFETVKKKPYFYLIFAMILLTGISLQSVGTISIIYMEDLEMKDSFVAATATVSSLVLTCSKFLTGFSYDKKGLRFTLFVCHCCSMVAYLLKANLTNSTIGMVFAMTATILGTIAMPLETVMIPLMSNDLFGTASYTKVLGIFYAANSLGLCLGSPLCDLYREHTGGSYASCYWFFSGLMLIVTVSFQLVIPAAYKEKEKVLSTAKVDAN